MSRLIFLDLPHPLDMLPTRVRRGVEGRVLHQYKFGVTGPIACGKTHVCRALEKRFQLLGIPCRHVSYDALVREIYEARTMETEHACDCIAQILGEEVQNPTTRSLDRKAVADRLFNTRNGGSLIDRVEHVLAPHVFRLERERLAGFRGVALIEAATLVERGLLPRVGNRVIIVDAKGRDEMIRARNLDPLYAANVARHQLTVDMLMLFARKKIVGDPGGFVMTHRNRWGDEKDGENAVRETAQWILAAAPGLQREIEPID